MLLGDFQRAVRVQTPRVWVTPAIIFLNAAVFVAMLARGVNPVSPTTGDIVKWGANFGPYTLNGQWWRLGSSMFLHIGILHIAMNMFVLWGIGGFVERLYGNVCFLAIYLAAGLAGGVASELMHPLVPSAGASGAVFGVYGALGAYLLRQRAVIPREALQSLAQSTIVFVGYNLIFGLTARGIDMAAHVGGLVGGFVFAQAAVVPIGTRGAGRVVRAIAILALAAGMVVVALRVVRAPEPDAAEVVGEAEAPTVPAYNELSRRHEAHEISDEELARGIEERVLPPWHEARERLERARGGGERDDAWLAFMRAREEAWREMVRAARAHDGEALDKAYQHLKAADELAPEKP